MGKYDFAFDLYEDSPLAWIAKTIKTGSTVLEFGSANGRLTKYLHLEKKCFVDIVEIDEDSGREASLYAAHSFLGTEEGDIEKYHWSFSEVKYDYIIFADVLEHLFNPQEALKRCKAVLSPHGKILVSIPNISHNSIIIELINDRFQYTSTGLLDNTHIKFFTRQSFIAMAEKVGWSIVSESAKYIRVGEHEIVNSYSDVPKEVYKALINRDSGNVYQYMFTLASSQEYITGECPRLISLDASSYYFMEIMYEYEGSFNYKHSASRHVRLDEKEITVSFPICAHSQGAKIKLLNCNAILKLDVKVYSTQNVCVEKEIQHNGTLIGDIYYFIDNEPEITLSLCDSDKRLEISLSIIQYDFDRTVYANFLDIYAAMQQQINELQSGQQTYEQMIQRKDLEFLESVKIYEEEIRKKDEEFRESAKIYEEEIGKKDAEFEERVNIYENTLHQKEQILQETIEKYQLIIKQKELNLQKTTEKYQEIISQKEDELLQCVEQYEKEIHKKDEDFLKEKNVYGEALLKKEQELQESRQKCNRHFSEWIKNRRTK